MPRPSLAQVEERLGYSFALDDVWRITMGLPEGDSKEKALVELERILEGIPHAIIGGIAVQIWTEDPRSTRDIDIAVSSFDDIPEELLHSAGFVHEGRYEHSDNWRAPGPTSKKEKIPVQFSAGPEMVEAVERAESYSIRGSKTLLRVVGLADLIGLKLEAGLEPRRRSSKRISDYGDIQRLLEEHPEVEGEISGLRAKMKKIHSMIG